MKAKNVYDVVIILLLLALVVENALNLLVSEKTLPPEASCYFSDNKTYIVIKAGGEKLENVKVLSGTKLLCELDEVEPYTQRVCDVVGISPKDVDRVVYITYNNKVSSVLCLGTR